jgi:hypothetical protein
MVVAAEQSVLWSPVCRGIIAKYGHYSRISAQRERNFSAVKTAWRSAQDSNPGYNLLRPHVSVGYTESVDSRILRPAR